jgi:hypothetical protein
MDATGTDATELAPPGAVITALTIVEALENRAGGRPPDEVAAEIQVLLAQWETGEILRAFGLLITIALRLVEQAPERPDVFGTAVTPVLSRLRELAPAELPADGLPTAAGILTAAATGQDPYGWWSRLSPADGPEADLATWSYPTWLLVDYVDAVVLDQPGAFARMVTATIIEPAGEAPPPA